jgi:hypothetical protein
MALSAFRCSSALSALSFGSNSLLTRLHPPSMHSLNALNLQKLQMIHNFDLNQGASVVDRERQSYLHRPKSGMHGAFFVLLLRPLRRICVCVCVCVYPLHDRSCSYILTVFSPSCACSSRCQTVPKEEVCTRHTHNTHTHSLPHSHSRSLSRSRSLFSPLYDAWFAVLRLGHA